MAIIALYVVFVNRFSEENTKKDKNRYLNKNGPESGNDSVLNV